MKEAIVRAEALCKTYETHGQENQVLKNVDVAIYKGEFTVIMGSSGSGKSTLLYNMAGMDKPTAGKVYFGDTRTDNLKEAALAEFRRGDVGFVFQQMHLVSNLSILENVTMPGYLLGKKSSREIERRAVELLALTGIQDLKDRLPSQVSGGQQQRAGIARALINQPALLFADEPTGALNSKTGREILDLLGQLNRNGQSILMVTHDLKAATRADRIIYLHDGQIAGELRLEQYTPDAAPEREQVALAWLTEKGW